MPNCCNCGARVPDDLRCIYCWTIGPAPGHFGYRDAELLRRTVEYVVAGVRAFPTGERLYRVHAGVCVPESALTDDCRVFRSIIDVTSQARVSPTTFIAYAVPTIVDMEYLRGALPEDVRMHAHPAAIFEVRLGPVKHMTDEEKRYEVMRVRYERSTGIRSIIRFSEHVLPPVAARAEPRRATSADWH